MLGSFHSLMEVERALLSQQNTDNVQLGRGKTVLGLFEMVLVDDLLQNCCLSLVNDPTGVVDMTLTFIRGLRFQYKSQYFFHCRR